MLPKCSAKKKKRYENSFDSIINDCNHLLSVDFINLVVIFGQLRRANFLLSIWIFFPNKSASSTLLHPRETESQKRKVKLSRCSKLSFACFRLPLDVKLLKAFQNGKKRERKIRYAHNLSAQNVGRKPKLSKMDGMHIMSICGFRIRICFIRLGHLN